MCIRDRGEVADCYSLVRDFYRLDLGVVLPDFPRDRAWWLEGPSMFTEERLRKTGFRRVGVDELKAGDSVTFTINSKIINHCGVYIGEGLLLHHLWNRLSRREPLGPWRKCAGSGWRIKP